MKAVIDIGSNSVRLAVFDGERMVEKRKITCQLARGLAFSQSLSTEKQVETIVAIKTLVEIAKKAGVNSGDVFAFATAAVRNSVNGREFAKKACEITGANIDVVSGEIEAELATIGALGKCDGCVLDVGGGSSELAIKRGGKIVYDRSLSIGAVILTDMFGKDRKSVDAFLTEKVKEYGDIGLIDRLIVIGGTAQNCEKVLCKSFGKRGDGYISAAQMEMLDDKFFTADKDELVRLGVEKERADIIAGGAAIVSHVMKYARARGIVVSDSDNLVGYYKYKFGGGR